MHAGCTGPKASGSFPVYSIGVQPYKDILLTTHCMSSNRRNSSQLLVMPLQKVAHTAMALLAAAQLVAVPLVAGTPDETTTFWLYASNWMSATSWSYACCAYDQLQ